MNILARLTSCVVDTEKAIFSKIEFDFDFKFDFDFDFEFFNYGQVWSVGFHQRLEFGTNRIV